MAYITANELKAVVPDKYRDAALSDTDGTNPDVGLLKSVIDTASNEVDALIEGRVQLPLTNPPKKLKIAALYIALEILFIRKTVDLPESTANKINFWRKWLSKVGAGELRLEAPDVDSPEPSTTGGISTTPSLTGTGGLISCFLLGLFLLARPAQAIDARTYNFTAPTNPLFESPDFLEWSQAESVGLRYTLSSSDSKDARWEISDTTNLWLNMEPSKSGSTWSWNPSPTQTCLPAGRYQGRIAVYTRDAETNLTFHRVLALQDIRVHPARDPLLLVMASPLATLTGAYLTAEADTAALAALGVHAADTNAHDLALVRADVTAAADAAAVAQATADAINVGLSNGVDVVCSGSHYFPDFFTLAPVPVGYTIAAYGVTSAFDSVKAQWITYTGESGYLLAPQITRQYDWSEPVSYAALAGLQIVETNSQTIAQWNAGSVSGSVGRFTAALGDFSRNYTVTYSSSDTWSNQVYVSDVAGSLRDLINTSLTARAEAVDAEQNVYESGAYGTSNFLRNSSCWAAGVDLTSASPWNSYSAQFRAGTAVTPQHILYAAHWTCPSGTVFRFIDATNGIHNRTLIDQRILLDDCAVGLLDSPLPETITPAQVLSSDDKGYFRGITGLMDCPGIKVIYLDQGELAWQASSIISSAGDEFDDVVHFSGTTNDVFSRQMAIGGDSGNPILLVIGTNTVLYSTFYSASSGPGIARHADAIEAAMAEMGGSTTTNLTTVDLSDWSNYDWPFNPGE